MLILSIPLSAVTLIMVGIMLFFTKKATGQSGKYFARQQKNLGAVNGYIEEMMNGQKVVKVFCHEEESKEKFRELNMNCMSVQTVRIHFPIFWGRSMHSLAMSATWCVLS